MNHLENQSWRTQHHGLQLPRYGVTNTDVIGNLYRYCSGAYGVSKGQVEVQSDPLCNYLSRIRLTGNWILPKQFSDMSINTTTTLTCLFAFPIILAHEICQIDSQRFHLALAQSVLLPTWQQPERCRNLGRRVSLGMSQKV